MKKIRKLFIVFLLLLGFALVTGGLLFSYYKDPVSSDSTKKEIVIDDGTTNYKIGTILKENNLIKSELFFKIYLKAFEINDLKAGKYELSEDMSLADIIETIQKGNNFNDEEISITFKEGINMRKLATLIASKTNNSYDDVMDLNKDKDYLQSLIDTYWFITDDILNKDIYYPLEGYLYPDTYRFRNSDVSVKEIFNKLIKQMSDVLEPYKDKIMDSKFSAHEIITLASIAELEVSNSDDRKSVVSVFINRLNKKMSLGSDITTRYAVKEDDNSRVLKKSEYNSNNPYNTRSASMAGKLPVGPICMVSKDSLLASIDPFDTEYLYFLSNIKTKETFFFKYSSEFEKKKSELASVNGGL